MEVKIMITNFGKCSDSMTKDEIELWFSNNAETPFYEMLYKIVDFYDHSRKEEKELLEDCLGSFDFLRKICGLEKQFEDNEN